MSNEEEKKFEHIFERVRNYFDEMDEIREKILPIQRKIVRNCSEIIKQIHRKEIAHIEEKITETKKDLDQMGQILKQAPGEFSTDYLQIVQQEYGEAAILYFILKEGVIKAPEEVGIDLLEYTYALSDVVGELRRYIINCLREQDLPNAEKGFRYMSVIYDQLFTLDYPKGLLPGLRNKIDQVRGIVAKTEGDLFTTMNILRLNKNLEKVLGHLESEDNAEIKKQLFALKKHQPGEEEDQ